METTQKPDILKYAFMVTLTLFVIGLNASLSLKELAEGVMVILALFTIPRWREWPKFDKKFLVVMFLWVAGAFVSYYVFAPIDIPVEKTELPNFRWVFFFFAVVILAKFYLDWNWLQKMLAVVFAVSFVVDLALYFQTGGRAGGFGHNPINFANIIAPFVLISWAFVLQGFAQKKYDLWFVIHSFCVVAGSFLVLASQTRGVMIGLFPVMILVGIFFGRKTFLLSGSAVSIFLVTLFAFNDAWVNKVRDGISENNTDGSRVVRFAIWEANYSLWRDYPLIGVGYGVNNYLYFDRLPEVIKEKLKAAPDMRVTHAHNQFIQLLVGGGIFGLLLFLSILVFAYKYLFVLYRAQKDPLWRVWTIGLAAAFTCFLIAGGTEANFSVTKNRYIFLLLLAFILSLYQTSSHQKQEPNS